jgi:hypothetical protein
MQSTVVTERATTVDESDANTSFTFTFLFFVLSIFTHSHGRACTHHHTTANDAHQQPLEIHPHNLDMPDSTTPCVFLPLADFSHLIVLGTPFYYFQGRARCLPDLTWYSHQSSFFILFIFLVAPILVEHIPDPPNSKDLTS